MIVRSNIGDIRVSLSHDGGNYIVAVHHTKDGKPDHLLESLEYEDGKREEAYGEYAMLKSLLGKIAGIHNFS